MLLFAVVAFLNSDAKLVSALILQIQLLSMGASFFGIKSVRGIEHVYLQESLLAVYFLVFLFYNGGSQEAGVFELMRFWYLFCLLISVFFLIFDLVKILQVRLTLMKTQQKVSK